MKFSSLDESRSRHLQNFSVSMSLGLDKFSDISLEPNLLVSSFIVSTTFVLVSMFLWSRSRSRLWDSDPFSLGLGIVIETQTFSASVSISSLRLRHVQSQSCHGDYDIFGLGLGLDDPNLVSMIPDLNIESYQWEKLDFSYTRKDILNKQKEETQEYNDINKLKSSQVYV